MRTLSSTYIASKTLLTLQLLCWCCFFALPGINAQGQVSGYWVSLCTTAGIELVKIEPRSGGNQNQHESSQCPCVQDVIDLASPNLIHQGGTYRQAMVSLQHAPLLSFEYQQPPARAPPTVT